MADITLWVLIALFVVWEVVAHFAFHNRQIHTLSNRIWALESRFGLPAKVGVGSCIFVLFLHLVLHLF